jgi:hypothetical protein
MDSPSVLSPYNFSVALEHDAVPRFTPEQRDEILNIAARLQAQHEGTVGADELIRAAQEAGIDPRFVHQAAMQVARKPQVTHTNAPLVAIVLFTLQAGLFMRGQVHWYRQGSNPFDLPTMFCAFFFAAVLGHFAGRDRRLRWCVPLITLATWASLIVAYAAYEWSFGPYYGLQLPTSALGLAVFQAAAALMGSLINEAPEGAKSFRLYRKAKAR